MIKNICLIFILLSLSLLTQAKDAGMSTKWNRLNHLIDEEIKTIKTITKMGPRLRWRLIELNTERIKLVREKENKTFLNAKSSLRKSKGKDWFFRDSKNLYFQVRKDALAIIKKWPRFKYSSEIYYTLALNSRDYGGDKETEKFLLKSLKNAIPHSPIIHAAKTSLAEYYYNGKKYKKAIRYYTDVLKNKEDEWYTKHLYNVAWCFIKTKDYDKAIENAKLSFFNSKDKNYISVRNQVLESIGFFFVLAERVEEGAKFYVDNVEKPGEFMIKMAKKTAEDRGYEKAEYVFNAALNNSIDKKNLEEEIEIRLSQLDFYRNFKKFENFWTTTVALDEINKVKPLGDDFQVTAVEKIRSFVGYLQVRFTRNSKTNIENYDEDQKKRILHFFDVLSRINSEETDNYRYYQGETLFAISDFKGSFDYYQLALEHNKTKFKTPVKKDKTEKKAPKLSAEEVKEQTEKHEALKLKIFDSLLSSLENGNFNNEERYNRTVYTYKNHIEVYPKNERTRVIYSKLFNLYLKRKEIPNSQNTLEQYISAYKNDNKIQQGMFTQILDFYIKTKDSDKIALWIPKLKGGFLAFDKDYIEKAVLILGSILFDSYQKLDGAGKKDEAAKGYLALFESEKYPQSIKAKSAYRASILFLDLYQTKEAYKWMNISLGLFTEEERFQRKKEILAFVQTLMLSQDFTSSARVASRYITIYCSKPFKEKEELYQASVQYELIEGNDELAYSNYKLGKKCNIKKSVRNGVLLGMAQYFVRHRQYQKYTSFFNTHKKKAWLKEFFHTSFLAIYWDYYLAGNEKSMNQVAEMYKTIFDKDTPKLKAQIEMETVLAFNKLYPKLEKKEMSSLPDENNFKEDVFNKMLEKNIENLKKLAADLTPYIKSGYPHIVTKSYQLLEAKYSKLGNALMLYSPKGLPKEYLEGFKGAMNGLAQNLLKEARGQQLTAVRLINKENILNPDVDTIVGVPDIISIIKHRHPANLYVLPKDRKGGPL
ncbi:MAG: hypothetical protein K9K67_03685 [Bacteriovoracaceae bacterium]|nr:hypothetical protein [Bacteriovoracaceae bacterium]